MVHKVSGVVLEVLEVEREELVEVDAGWIISRVDISSVMLYLGGSR